MLKQYHTLTQRGKREVRKMHLFPIYLQFGDMGCNVAYYHVRMLSKLHTSVKYLILILQLPPPQYLLHVSSSSFNHNGMNGKNGTRV